MRKLLCFGAVLMLAGTGLASSQTAPQWTRGLASRAASPPSRFGGGMAYNAARGVSTLFGGLTASPGGPANLADTWILSQKGGWTQLSPAISPQARFNTQMVYDLAHTRCVLFGGGIFSNNGIIFTLGDTWSWDGANWTQQSPAASPSPRYTHAMAYDFTNSQTVLFGGVTASGYVGDTWVYDGTNWTQKFPVHSPSPRGGPSLTFQNNTGKITLFGGVNGNNVYGDTWQWDGTDWTQISTPVAPPARYAAGFTYDQVESQSILFAGTNITGNFNDTWAWTGSAWVQQNPPTVPAIRFYPQMDYDVSAGRLVLYGGGQGSQIGDIYLYDTWTWQ